MVHKSVKRLSPLRKKLPNFAAVKGKTVIPFITSGSTGISSAASELKSAYPDISWKSGDRLNGKSSEELKSWLGTLGIKVK